MAIGREFDRKIWETRFEFDWETTSAFSMLSVRGKKYPVDKGFSFLPVCLGLK